MLLMCAVIRQAAVDYLGALKYLAKYETLPDEKAQLSHARSRRNACAKNKSECELFFTSGISWYTDLDGEAIMAEIQSRSRDKKYRIKSIS